MKDIDPNQTEDTQQKATDNDDNISLASINDDDL